jgi:dipeptidase E
MKLFLSSLAIKPDHADEFLRLVDKPASSIKFALITNASDVYPSIAKGFVANNRAMIETIGIHTDKVNLRDYHEPGDLQADLAEFDVIWLDGGNTYYLRWIARKSGFDQIIPGLVEQGIVYGGGSAGAIVAGPTLRHFEKADNPKDAPALIESGFALTDTVVIPHFGDGKYGGILAQAKAHLEAENFQTIAITDDQAVIIEDSVIKILD